MNVPADVVVWLLGAICLFVSFAVHLLIRINSRLTDIYTAHKVAEARVEFRLNALERHHEISHADTAQLLGWMKETNR
jgi:hypothetical protein